MEEDSQSPPVTTESESPVEEVAGGSSGMEEDTSSEGSRRRPARAEGQLTEDSKSSAEDSQKDTAAGSKSGPSKKKSIRKLPGGVSGSEADLEDTECPVSVASSTDLLEARDRAMEDLEADKQKDTHSIPVMDQCLEQVSLESDELRKFSREVLAKFDTNIEYNPEMYGYLPQDYKGPMESSRFVERLREVENYLTGAYRTFAFVMNVSGNLEQVVEEASAEGSESSGEGVAEKKRKTDSEASRASKAEKQEEPAGMAMEWRGEGTSTMTESEFEDAPSWVSASEVQSATTEITSVGTASSSKGGAVQKDEEEPIAGTSSLTRPTEEERKACEIARTSRKVIKRQRGALHHITDTTDAHVNKMRLACDFLLLSIKSIVCVVGHAINTLDLCPLLLKLSETELNERTFAAVRYTLFSTTHTVGLAVEAAEAAVQYHRGAVGYVRHAEGARPMVQVYEKLGDEVLQQVLKAAEEVENLARQEPSVSKKEMAEKRDVVAEMARILSPALKRVKDANAYTKILVEKFDSAVLYKAMEVTVKAATEYTRSVISDTKKVLGVLAESKAGPRGGVSTEEASTEPATTSEGDSTAQSSATSSES